MKSETMIPTGSRFLGVGLPRLEALRMSLLAWVMVLAVVATGCRTGSIAGRPLKRQGDEIVAAGQLFHTGAKVVLWMDPGGYDAYRVERRFAPWPEAGWETTRSNLPPKSSPNRYGLRAEKLTPAQVEQVRGGGWPLAMLQDVVDQFVLHFDASGTSRRCFETLHDKRCLSVHFMIDLDGTIYQTLDLKERAWHATTSNSRSIGVEIASPGAFSVDQSEPLQRWYRRDSTNGVQMVLPNDGKNPGFMKPDFVAKPRRSDPVEGQIQGKKLKQYDFTQEQYDALIQLTATLCSIFPKIHCDYPRDPVLGSLVTSKLPDPALKGYQGLIGHYHIQTDKVDPGPAMDWDYVIDSARKKIRVRR